jgi:hypothetical protein
MNQRKTNDAETSAKTCISHAARSPIQGKTTVREVSRTGARFRETAPGFANWIHKHGTAIRDKGPSLRAFRSGGPRHTHFNFQTRSVRELGTFRSQYANQEPTRLRQPIAKTRILTFADSRNLAHRQPRGITDRQSFAPNVTTAALLNRNTSGKTTHTPQLKALRLDNPSLQKASRHE